MQIDEAKTMKISTKGRYGLRVMMELATKFGQGPVLVATIATNQSISGNYIHILLASLKGAGLVRALRGPAGGYELTCDPGEITALDVVRALEGYGWPVSCVSKDKWCAKSKTCAARDLWGELAAAMEKVLSDFTLKDLVTKQRAKSEDAAMFQI
jgi:Rrf2 family transcriptional regulator, cysteine metabolism repressor